MPNLLENYLTSQKLNFSHEIYGSYIFIKEFSADSRISLCKVILFTDEKVLHVLFELPLRFRRSESLNIYQELALINDELEKNQCYELDILSGTILFHTVVDFPETVEDLGRIIDNSVNEVAEDTDTLMQMIYKELISLEKEYIEANNTPSVVSESTQLHQDIECLPDQRVVLPQRKRPPSQNKWKEIGTSSSFSYDEMKDILQTSDNEIIIMQGPSGCGKSYMLKQLQDHGDRSVAFLTAEDLRDYITDRLTKKHSDTFLISEKTRDHGVICIENLDWLFTTQHAQMTSAFLASEFAKTALVVINGVDYQRHTPILLDNLKPPARIFQCDEGTIDS